ncbi:MAG TPA: GNAT family N-acetyltransferase [Candidatus Limnocylindrales bacterium]
MTTVRPGRGDDIEVAVAIFVACGTARHPERPVPEARASEVRSTLAAAEVWFYVALDEDQVVGFAAAMQSREDFGAGPIVPGLCYLDLIFVEPEKWGKGIGALLLDTVIDDARDLGFARIHLLTHDDNLRAHGLYESRGFARSGWSRVSSDAANGMVSDWARPL